MSVGDIKIKKFEIIDTGRWGFSVKVNDEIILECLSEQEVCDLTIRQVLEVMEEIDG